MKLNTLLTKKEKDEVQILAVSVDDHQTSKRFAQHLGGGSPGGFNLSMLEDKNHKVIDRYGIFNPNGPGWPHPATYIIDRQGVIRWRFVEVDYIVRPSNKQILQALGKIP